MTGSLSRLWAGSRGSDSADQYEGKKHGAWCFDASIQQPAKSGVTATKARYGEPLSLEAGWVNHHVVISICQCLESTAQHVCNITLMPTLLSHYSPCKAFKKVALSLHSGISVKEIQLIHLCLNMSCTTSDWVSSFTQIKCFEVRNSDTTLKSINLNHSWKLYNSWQISLNFQSWKCWICIKWNLLEIKIPASLKTNM